MRFGPSRYRELQEEQARRHSLESAILLISARAERGVGQTVGWLAFLRFVEDGWIVKEARAASEPEALCDALRKSICRWSGSGWMRVR